MDVIALKYKGARLLVDGDALLSVEVQVSSPIELEQRLEEIQDIEAKIKDWQEGLALRKQMLAEYLTRELLK